MRLITYLIVFLNSTTCFAFNWKNCTRSMDEVQYSGLFLSSTELIGIGGLSGYQAFGQNGNWTDNFLDNSGGNLALGLAGAKVASYLPTDIPYLRLGFKALGGISLVNNIVKATEGINKKYQLTK